MSEWSQPSGYCCMICVNLLWSLTCLTICLGTAATAPGTLGCTHLFSPSFPFLLPPMSGAGKASYWEFGICESQVHARNGDWALVFECFPSNSITHQYRKVSLHWIPWHNSIKCFSSKQKTLCNPDALLTASTLRQKAKPCILPQHIKNTFNNQLRFRSALIKA